MRANTSMGLHLFNNGFFYYTILISKEDGTVLRVGRYPNTEEGREACTKAWEDLDEILCEIGE